MSGEKYGSKTDVVVKLVLVFFIALLSFSIGTFVGKKFSDNQYKLSQLEPQNGHSEETASNDDSSANAENRGIASIPANAGDMKPDKALTDDEIAKLASEFVSDDEGTKKQEANPTTAAAGVDQHETAAKVEGKTEAKAEVKALVHGVAVAPVAKTVMNEAQPLKPAERMAEGRSPVVANPPKATSRIPSSLPKEAATSAVGKYTVQIASFASEKEAQKKAAELKDKGYSAFYVAAKIKGQSWFRVSVGLFTTQKEADTYKKDLVKNGKVASAIVQRITNK
jgi:cell division septation protein DedD